MSCPSSAASVSPRRLTPEYNKDLQREEYVTTCRYGFKLYRPENLVTVLSDASQV